MKIQPNDLQNARQVRAFQLASSVIGPVNKMMADVAALDGGSCDHNKQQNDVLLLDTDLRPTGNVYTAGQFMRHAKLQQSGSQVKFEADGRLEAGAWRTSEIKVTRDEDSTEYRVTTRGQMDQPDTLKVRVDHETGLMDVGGYYLGGLPARIKEESRWNF